jgi:hypothetical protein
MRVASATPLGAARERERGQILVLFAFVLIALLLVSALAVDYGGWLLARRSYQNASDQASIAGAYLLTSQITDDCTPGVSKNHCAREAAWTSLQAHLGLTLGGLTPFQMANSIGDTAYTESNYSIWVASPPSDAGAAYPGVASSTKTIFVRVDRVQQANLSRIIQASTNVGAWATAGRIPNKFAIITLCGPPDCEGNSGENFKVNGNGSLLVLESGDIGSNSFIKTSGVGAAIALSPESTAYMHDPGQCQIGSTTCTLIRWDGTPRYDLPQSALFEPRIPDPGYAAPPLSSTTVPWQCRPFGTGAAISAIPADDAPFADGGPPIKLASAVQPAPEPVVQLAASTIGGKVTDSVSGTGLNGATVQVVGPLPTGTTTYTVTTSGSGGNAGGYSIPGVTPSGQYTMTVTLANYGTQSFVIDVSVNGPTTLPDIQLVPNPGTISGAISGPIVSGITVSTDNGATGVTDGTGAYTISNVTPGSRVVTPTPPVGYISTPASRTVTVAPGGTVTGVNFVISAIPTGTVSGTVTDATTNLPIPGVTVTITQGAGTGKSATTNGSGVYTMSGVNTGSNQRVTATLAGYTDEVSGNFTVSNGAVTTVNLAMWPARCGATNSTYARWDCGYGAGGCPAVVNPAGPNVSCAAFDNTNRIRPGTYERITISTDQCAWIDPLARPTGMQSGATPGIVYITDVLELNKGFLFGDGVTIVMGPDAQLKVSNGGGFVLNYDPGSGYTTASQLPTTNCDGTANPTYSSTAWTTKTRAVWDTSVNPPCYVSAGPDPAEIGMAFYLRGDPTKARFSPANQFGFLFQGVLYGPRDDIGLNGSAGQAAAGQIVAWTLTYGGSTTIYQKYSGLEVDGPPYLIEPFLGQ